MASKISTLLAILSILVICVWSIQARPTIGEDDKGKHLDRQLRVLNKPPIKSVKTDYGIIDCIDIYKQPAFDNPLLKNHKIQMRPSHLPSRGKKEKSPNFGKFEYRSGFGIDCPNGTVPIRRTAKDDLIRWRSSSVRTQDYEPFSPKDPNTYYAVVKLKKADRPYSSAQGSFDLHNPRADTGEASGARVWVYGGDGQSGNYISAGWMVDADLYGDPHTHLTASWKGDGGAGCANMQCPGFVQTYNDFHPGAVLWNISSYEGLLWVFNIKIFQDGQTGNWWLATGADIIPIGYWPKELFSQLGGGASYIAYGGITKAVPTRVTPPMGSGIADCDFTHTAFIGEIQYKVASDKMRKPDWSETEIHVDCPDVYTVQHNCGEQGHDDFAFMYGGVGGVC